MLKLFETKSRLAAGLRGRRLTGVRSIDELYEQELKDNMAALDARRRKARRIRQALDWAEYWPVAVGIALACFAPQLRALVEPFKPWGMWLVFPFVSMIERPEIHMSRDLSYVVPAFVLFAQFPGEGLLARYALRGQVTVKRVIGQMLFLHLMGALELWLVSGPWGGK